MIEIKHKLTKEVLLSLDKEDLRGAELQEAFLQGAKLQGACLQGASLRWANLREACLQGADLRGADLDFSSGIPFVCSSFDFHADAKLAAQLAYHFCRIDFHDAKVREAQRKLTALANTFHRADECGKIVWDK